MTKKPRNILLCVTGLTPQIVTETLYCLAVKERVSIDEIYVLTTQRGLEVLLGRGQAKHTPKTPLLTELKNLCKEHKLKIPAFSPGGQHTVVAKEESLELHDIRTDKENQLFPNKAMELVRDLTSSPDTVLYCSISGGRKSMGVHLAFAFALFARPADRLLHVLTAENFEAGNFYPKNRAEANALVLADLPVVPLRPLLTHYRGRLNPAEMSFMDVVAHTRKEIAVLTDPGKLQVDMRKREFIFMNNTVNVEPKLLAVYYFFIKHLQAGTGKLSSSVLTSKETANEIKEFMVDNFNSSFPQPDKNDPRSSRSWTATGFGKADLLAIFSKIKKKINKVAKEPELAEQFYITPDRQYGNTTYYLGCKPDKIEVSGI